MKDPQARKHIAIFEGGSQAFHSLSKSYTIRKKFHRAVFEIQALKAEMKGVLASHSFAMVTYCVMKIIPTCSPVIGQFFLIP